MHLSVDGQDTIVFIGDDYRTSPVSADGEIHLNENVIFIGDLNFQPNSVEIVADIVIETTQVVNDDFIENQDYNEFCRLYYTKIRNIVAGFSGICREDVEDETHKIIGEFIAGSYLSIYSREKQSAFAEARFQKQMALYESGQLDFKPERHLGKFSSFVWQFVKVRLMGIRDKSNRRISVFRSLDSYIEINKQESNSGNENETPLTIFFAVPDNEYQNIETRELCKNVYAHLVNVTTPTLTRNFPELFLVVIDDEFKKPEGFDRVAYASKKGITVSAVSMQLRELREHLIQFGFYKDLKQLVNMRHKMAK